MKHSLRFRTKTPQFFSKPKGKAAALLFVPLMGLLEKAAGFNPVTQASVAHREEVEVKGTGFTRAHVQAFF